MKNEKNDKEWIELIMELVGYRKDGIRLLLAGEESTPEEIADASMCCENGSYMRDYIQNDGGDLLEVRFDKVINR